MFINADLFIEGVEGKEKGGEVRQQKKVGEGRLGKKRKKGGELLVNKSFVIGGIQQELRNCNQKLEIKLDDTIIG